MVRPAAFAKVPVQTDPATGERMLDGRAGLPWALDTLETAGDIRAKFIRLQDWVRAMYGMKPLP